MSGRSYRSGGLEQRRARRIRRLTLFVLMLTAIAAWFGKEILTENLPPAKNAPTPNFDADPTKIPGPSETTGTPDPARLLTSVLDKYQNADVHRDRVLLKLTHEMPGATVDEATKIVSSYQRPNRLRLHASRDHSRMSIICNGQYLWSTIEDPNNHNFENQVVRRDAPAQLTVADLYTATKLIDPNQPEQPNSAWSAVPAQLHLCPLTWLLPGTDLSAEFLSFLKQNEDKYQRELATARVR